MTSYLSQPPLAPEGGSQTVVLSNLAADALCWCASHTSAGALHDSAHEVLKTVRPQCRGVQAEPIAAEMPDNMCLDRAGVTYNTLDHGHVAEGRQMQQDAFPCCKADCKDRAISRWPMAKARLFSVGRWQRHDYCWLASGKHEAIVHRPMARTKDDH